MGWLCDLLEPIKCNVSDAPQARSEEAFQLLPCSLGTFSWSPSLSYKESDYPRLLSGEAIHRFSQLSPVFERWLTRCQSGSEAIFSFPDKLICRPNTTEWPHSKPHRAEELPTGDFPCSWPKKLWDIKKFDRRASFLPKIHVLQQTVHSFIHSFTRHLLTSHCILALWVTLEIKWVIKKIHRLWTREYHSRMQETQEPIIIVQLKVAW